MIYPLIFEKDETKIHNYLFNYIKRLLIKYNKYKENKDNYYIFMLVSYLLKKEKFKKINGLYFFNRYSKIKREFKVLEDIIKHDKFKLKDFVATVYYKGWTFALMEFDDINIIWNKNKRNLILKYLTMKQNYSYQQALKLSKKEIKKYKYPIIQINKEYALILEN